MSNAKRGNIQNPQTVPEAITHLRRQLKLSMEKFGARVGCSFQTVHRWESGRATVTEGNLVRLWELAREHAPLAERVFANETRKYRRLLDSNAAREAQLLREELLSHGQRQLEGIRRTFELIRSYQYYDAQQQLIRMHEDLNQLMNSLRGKKDLK
jgi:DNA-binding transcriptional regulator YiaG